jgi:hypothetical protein
VELLPVAFISEGNDLVDERAEFHVRALRSI